MEGLDRLTDQELEELESNLFSEFKASAIESLFYFTTYTFANFSATWFHKNYYEKLDLFCSGVIKKLMVFVPPQHGKSEGSTRRAPAFILGANPDKKIGVVCYNSTKARKFNREIQRIIEDETYKELFPETNLSNGADGYARTNDEFEIVNHKGGLRSVGVGGPLTGETIDVLIMDDLYKDAKSAWSSTVRENIQDWYDTVAETRLHNDSQQLIVFTRWHENDLAGVLLETQKDWEVVVYSAIKEGDPTDEDPREDGEALFPEKHDLAKLESIRARNPHIFESLYQQNPQPKAGLLYGNFKTYTNIPASRARVIKNYTDTADTGSDYLCSVSYVETELACYVLDVIYTQEAMETTEPLTARSLTHQNVQIARVESNNGGRGFARNVASQCVLSGNTRTKVEWFFQGENKQVRIWTKSADVNNLVIFPEGWETRWPAFHKHITTYSAKGKNAHDDAEDTLTGIAEYFGKDLNLSNTSALKAFA